MKEIVEYARQRHITVIPEIEMPAHSEEVLAALPQLACGGDLKPGGEFCPGKELTYEFLTNVLKEVMELFPSEYIHIGGDEASTNHWKQCPDCQALMKAEGMKEEGELQEYLVSRIEKFLKENGRKMIGWDEILTGELDETSAVTVWRGEDKGAESVKEDCVPSCHREHIAILTATRMHRVRSRKPSEDTSHWKRFIHTNR